MINYCKREIKQLYMYNRNLKALIKERNDRIYESEHGIFVKETNITVTDWFNTWMKEYKLNSVKTGTYTNYERVFDLYIKNEIGSRKISNIRPEHIQHIYNEMVGKNTASLP